ncbi:MAG: hypothetical protein ACTSU2_08155 [Promethearchaeota archaeon]
MALKEEILKILNDGFSRLNHHIVSRTKKIKMVFKTKAGKRIKAPDTEKLNELRRKIYDGLKTSNFTKSEWELIFKYRPYLFYDSKEPFFPIAVGASIYYKPRFFPSKIEFFKGWDDVGKYFLNVDEYGKFLGYRASRKLVRFREFVQFIFLTLFYQRNFKLIHLWANRFGPLRMTIFDGKRTFHRAAKVIEYAFYYHADIGHIYELEHVWAYLDKENNLIGIKGSRHGMPTVEYANPDDIKYYKGHPYLFASPGKHANYTSPREMHRRVLIRECTERTAKGVMKDIPFFTKEDWYRIMKVYPDPNYLAETFRKKYAFTPSFKFNRYCFPGKEDLIPWDELRQRIPMYIAEFLKML